MSNLASTASMKAWEFWRDVLKSPRMVVAPMVDGSELAFRMLCRNYGATLAYTPMFHAGVFSRDSTYRATHFSTCEAERSQVVAQFCGDHAETLVAAARLVQDQVAMVGLNLGCPQAIAKRGHYGAFLLDEPDLVVSLARALVEGLNIPVECKIRVQVPLEKTLSLAKRLEEAGISVLTVHGRTRDMKGPMAPHADWEAIRQVKNAVSIPVIANGSVDTYADVDECLRVSGADAVMSAYHLLKNPALFSGRTVRADQLAAEYLDLAEKYPADSKYSIINGHLFKLLTREFEGWPDLRDRLLRARGPADYRAMIADMSIRLDDPDKFPRVESLADKRKRNREEAAAANSSSSLARSKTKEKEDDNDEE